MSNPDVTVDKPLADVLADHGRPLPEGWQQRAGATLAASRTRLTPAERARALDEVRAAAHRAA